MSTPVNYLVRIADKYWLIRNQWAQTIGVVALLSTDVYMVHMDDQLPATFANLRAVAEHVGSDAEHTIDNRLTRDTLDKLATYASNL